TAVATMLNVMLGAQAPSRAQLGAWPGILSAFAIVLLVPGFGGAWEAPGWRGYAVPRLQHGRSALVASLILGVLIAGWHLPLIVVGQVAYPDIVLILAAVIVFNWVFNNAKGSVLIIMLMHAANNAVSGNFFNPMFTGADSIRESWLLALVWAVVAVVVIAVSGPTNLSRKHPRQQEPLPDSEPETVGPMPAREQEGLGTSGTRCKEGIHVFERHARRNSRRCGRCAPRPVSHPQSAEPGPGNVRLDHQLPLPRCCPHCIRRSNSGRPGHSRIAQRAASVRTIGCGWNGADHPRLWYHAPHYRVHT